jgi:hypothetical protein
MGIKCRPAFLLRGLFTLQTTPQQRCGVTTLICLGDKK